MTQTVTINSGSLVVGDFTEAPWISTIQNLNAGAVGSPTTVSRDAAWTVVMVNSTGSNINRVAPSSYAFQMNDYLEVWDGGVGGGKYVQLSTAAADYIGVPCALRKISTSSSGWGVVP
jgi:hypothetical protein